MRASWGKNGSLSNLGDWKYATLYARSTNGISSVGESNPDLKWEESVQTDVAADLGFFNNRITLTLDYYRKETKGLLLQKTLPEYVLTRGAQPWFNAGNVLNHGLELEATIQQKEGDFHYTVNLNGSFLKNKVSKTESDIRTATRCNHRLCGRSD